MTRYIVKFSNGKWSVVGRERSTLIRRFDNLQDALNFAAAIS
jgi:hypothetical protein